MSNSQTMIKSIFLNVKLPGDDRWGKVSIEVATRGMRAKDSLNDDQLERRLDITGPSRDPPRLRAASVADPPPSTSAWTRRTAGSTLS